MAQSGSTPQGTPTTNEDNMEEILTALRKYFDLLDSPEEHINDWEYLEQLTEAEEDLRRFVYAEDVEYKLPDFITKGTSK